MTLTYPHLGSFPNFWNNDKIKEISDILQISLSDLSDINFYSRTIDEYDIGLKLSSICCNFTSLNLSYFESYEIQSIIIRILATFWNKTEYKDKCKAIFLSL